jgi:3-oxoacyl-[acyl-carrier-protein] synthase III
MWKCDIWSPAREVEEGRARDRVMSPDSNLSPEEKSVGSVCGGVAITGWAAALGARRVLSEEVDRAFGMPIGKLRTRAGIESVSYAAEGETELTLGAQAMQQALGVAGCQAKEIDWIIASSETHVEYPSLAAQLHKRASAREKCGVLDAGGACLGLLNALAVAQSFLDSGRARNVAVVTADVHSRTLVPGRVAGEFGGLFGDGASAFILRKTREVEKSTAYLLGRFFFGCANQYAEAICVAGDENGGLAVRFDGEALSRAAITRMERMLTEVEKTSGISRQEVGAFATHQPNPRLVTLLAKQCNVPAAVFPEVARKSGNLGSSTCGVALHVALDAAAKMPVSARKPIFLASLGPGLLYGGGWLTPARSQRCSS